MLSENMILVSAQDLRRKNALVFFYFTLLWIKLVFVPNIIYVVILFSNIFALKSSLYFYGFKTFGAETKICSLLVFLIKQILFKRKLLTNCLKIILFLFV